MTQEKKQQGRLRRLTGVRELVDYSKPQLYKLMKRPIDPFPGPLHIAGGSASFWREDEVLAWIERNISKTPNPPVAKKRSPAPPAATGRQ
jgi:predicted DNA-binding transcriptional regulator AlpA